MALSRLEKPIGFMLLFFPCLWGLTLGSPFFPDIKWIALLFVGAVVMRGAGCTYNDMVDRDIDRRVMRTASRPLAANVITMPQAATWLVTQVLLGFLILIALPARVFWLAMVSLAIVALYPWVKRLSHWPQLVLGLAFNWGLFVGWFIVQPHFQVSVFLFYGAGIFWTLAFDTIYAHQDVQDDLLVGVKSTAVRFRENSKSFIHFCYGACWCLMMLGGFFCQLGWVFIGLFFLMAVAVGLQIHRLDLTCSQQCLRAFQRNQYIGLAVWLCILSAKAMRIFGGV